MTISLIKGLADLSTSYDGFILDIWGVIHEGGQAYDEAIDCVQRLRTEGKRVIFLSNAPRRAKLVADVLEQKGVPRQIYDDLLSSGEATRIAFESGYECFPPGHLRKISFLCRRKSLKNRLQNGL